MLNRLSPAARLAYLLALAVVALDQISKAWVLYGLRLAERYRVELSPVFDLTMVWNRGFSFGLLSDGGPVARWLLVIFSVLVTAALAVWATKPGVAASHPVRVAGRTVPLMAPALGLIMGGAVGNAIDRARFGAVVDFLDFSGLMFPYVFNVADAGITAGVILLLIDAFLSDRRKAEPRPTVDTKSGSR